MATTATIGTEAQADEWVAAIRAAAVDGSLAAWRADHGLSRADLARAVGVSRSLVCRWEKVQRSIGYDAAYRVAMLIEAIEAAGGE